jgi:hypothetical protein
MQAMTILDQEHNTHQHAEGGQYAIYMKLATTRTTPRAISLTTMQTQMKRAWRANYGDIIQAHEYVFKVTFPSFLAMMWVYERRKWTLGPHILLLEFTDPEGESFQI